VAVDERTITAGTTFKRCGCTDPNTGKPLGSACPRLRRGGHGSWYFYADLTTKTDGKRRRVRQGGFRTEGDARDALDKALKVAATMTSAAGEALTVRQWLEYWLAEKGKTGAASAAGKKIRGTTVRSYQAHLDLYLVPYLGDLPLAELTEHHISDMFESIEGANAERRRPVRTATMRRIFATLRAALNEAVRRRRIAANPCIAVQLNSASRPKAVVWTDERVAAWRAGGPRPKVAVWTPAQTGAFLDFAADDRLYAIFHLITFRGLRRGEAVGLRWTDVDMKGAMLTVERQVVQIGWQTTESEPKSDSGARIVALDSGTVSALAAHRERQNVEREAAGDGWVESGRVFTQPDGYGLHPGHVTGRFFTLTRGADLPPIRLHDLRHGAATLALASGANLKVVQEMLGHSSITITADTYTSVLPVVAAQAAEAAARLVPRRPTPSSQ
jgi:integrase